MTKSPTADQLLAAARAVKTTFEGCLTAPVAIEQAARLAPAETEAVLGRYTRHAFAVIQLTDVAPDERAVLQLTRALGLGDAFIPPLYAVGGRVPPAVSRISAVRNEGTADANHPSFGRSGRQELHSDGTLQNIGFVKSTVLLCEEPAAEGGETTLFNATAAFAELVRTDYPAAYALATPGTLVRTANINSSVESNAGPAFAVADGALISRYSVTATDSWATPAGVRSENLERGIAFLSAAARQGSAYFAQFRLEQGQAIVFDNTRISHGRTAYRGAVGRGRCVYRSLHLSHPSPTSAHTCTAEVHGSAETVVA